MGTHAGLEQGWSTSVSEALAIRSLQNGTQPDLQAIAQWMSDHQVTDADIKGQSDYKQAMKPWCPLITIGCSIPYFLRKELPSQLGDK
eukprot:7368455-Heterocapsa_arctica.AAC.1